MNSVVIFIEIIIGVLVRVAFLTLLERKVLGYIQIRKGPNKVGFIGLLQPFRDAIKLFRKETLIILKSNYLFYIFRPLLRIILIIIIWSNSPILSITINSKFSLIVILCLLRMGVYSIIVAGWSSNSIYSLIGGLRRVAQTISYEVRIILIILSVIYLRESFNIYKFINYQYYLIYFIILFPISIIYFVRLLAELNRTPFDFAEGESELVSGFNTEYMRGRFALIFIAEYGIIIFIIFIFIIIFCGSNIYKISFYLIYIFILFFVIWIRGTYPRFRYDNLIFITWKSYLPIRLIILIYLLGIKLII